MQVNRLEGIQIVSYCSPLYFANAEIFRGKVIKKVCQSLSEDVSGEKDYLNLYLCAHQTGLDPGKVLLARKKFLKKQKDKEKQEAKEENSLNKLDNMKRRMSSLVAMKAQVNCL